MTDPTLRTYVDKWLAARPAQHLALAFLGDRQRDVRLALAALEQELISAAYGIREPSVAATKLNWWGEELAGAPVSGGRHPLVKALFADADVRAVDPTLWVGPIMPALAQLDQATPADFATQLAMAERFHGALARLETRIWFGAGADAARAARMATLDHLLQATTLLQEHASAARLPLPMARLARHHLDRDGLGHAGAARRAALTEQLADLRTHWREAWTLPGPLSLFRGLDARLGERAARRAGHAARPLARLREDHRRHQTGLVALRMAWSAARAARRKQVD